jgi:CheY-like chemotaxis protein
MRRILIVDNPHIGQAMRAWLDQHGFRISVADGGINGLAALDGSAFDLMIIDVFMPSMRGFEFHRRAPIRLFCDGARLPGNGHQARRRALSAQAVELARGDR